MHQVLCKNLYTIQALFATWVHHTSSSALSDVEGLPSSFLTHNLDPPESLKDNCAANNLNGYQNVSPTENLNIPIKPILPATEYVTQLENHTLKPQPQQQGISS